MSFDAEPELWSADSKAGDEVQAGRATSNRLAVGASVSVGGTMAGRGIQVVGQIVLARLLGPEAFGLYAIGWTILRLTYVVSGLGLDRAVIRYASSYRNENGYDLPRLKGLLNQSFWLSLLSGVIIGGGLFLLAPWLAVEFFKKPELTPIIRWLVPALVIVGALKVDVAATTVSQRMIYSVYSEKLAQPVVSLVLFLFFYWLGFGLLGAVVATSISFVVAFVIARYYVRMIFSEALGSRERAVSISKEVLSFSVLASAAGMVGIFNIWIDRLMVGYFLPATQGGIYQAATESSIFFATVIGAFGAIFSPMIADLHARGDSRELNELFKISTKWGLYVSLPPFLIIVMFPTEFMNVLFGSAYSGGATPLVILAVGQIINVASGAVGLLLVMTGHQTRWFWISIFVLTLNVSLSIFLIPAFGLTGASIATAASLTVLFSAGLFEVRRYIGIWPYDLRYLKGIAASLIATGALLLLKLVEIRSDFLELSLGSFFSFGFFLVVLVILGFDEEDRRFTGLISTKVAGALRSRTSKT